MTESNEMSDDKQNFLAVRSDPCEVCRRLTVRTVMGNVEAARGENYKEPMICNRCLLDMRGDMVTEQEVRRQLGNLEAKVEGYAWKQWILYFAFTLALAGLTFLAGLYIG